MDSTLQYNINLLKTRVETTLTILGYRFQSVLVEDAGTPNDDVYQVTVKHALGSYQFYASSKLSDDGLLDNLKQYHRTIKPDGLSVWSVLRG